MKTIEWFFAVPWRRLRAVEDNVMRSKMADYATGNEFYGNFLRTAERYNLSPLQVWGVLWDKHFGALESFFATGELHSESLEERIIDLRNYLALLYAITLPETDTQ